MSDLLRGLLAFAGGAAVSAPIVAAVHRIALRASWLDLPNNRSSHDRPTPTGGGIGIMLASLAALALLPKALPGPAILAGALSVAAVAIVGLMDDAVGLPPGPRLAVHALAGLAIGWTAGLAATDPGSWAVAAIAGWTFVVVASINVTNFMDGIDGLIGATALIYFAFVATAIGLGDPRSAMPLAAAGAALGFLVFNRPPARIFMGDVGSGGLGALFVLLGLSTLWVRDWSILHGFLPLAPLVADEILTMAGRVTRGERLTRAHRSHVYQILVRSGWGHGRVTLLYAVISTVLAAASLLLPRDTPAFASVAGSLLVLTAVSLMFLRERALRPSGRSPEPPPIAKD